jgi:hypothetical protein
VINLGRKVQPPQCDAEKELHPGHDAVAIADAHGRLGQVQLETTNVIRGGRIGRPLEKCSEPLAAGDVASLAHSAMNLFKAVFSASVHRQRVLSHAPRKYRGRPIENC